jgi:hypothetical protein
VVASTLSEASYTIYATATDQAGNKSGCSAVSASYVVDTTAPSVPTGLTLNSPATSPNNDATPTINISGLANGNDVGLFTDSGCSSQVATGTSSGANHNLTSSSLGDSTHNFYANSTDPAGNTSACSSATVQYVLDTAAPAKPSGIAFKSPASSPSNDTTPEFTISGVISGDTVRLFSDACTTEVANGTAVGTTIDLTASALAEATHNIYANSTDPSGNTSVCSTATISYVVDVTPPSAPSAVALTVPASSPGNDTTPTFNVDGVVNGDTVAIYTDASCTASIGSATSTGTDMDVTSNVLSQSTYTVYAASTDPAGNKSACSATNAGYVLDTTAPVKPNGLSLNTPATSPNNDDTPIINVSGVVSGDTVKLFTDSGCTTQVGTGVAGAASIAITSSSLGDATHDFYSNSTDPAGNVSLCSTATVQYVLDTNAPGKPTSIAFKVPASSPSNDTTPEFTIGGVISGDTVRLFSDACTTEVASGIAAGTTIDLTASAMTEATYTMYANSTDAAGNVSVCSTVTRSYTLDTSAPGAPSGVTLTVPAATPGNDTTPTFSIAGVAATDFVEIYSDVACSSLEGSATSAGTSVSVTTGVLAEAAYTFYATATDAAGNKSVCSTANEAYTVDTTPPAKPSGLALNAPATSPNNDTTPSISISGLLTGNGVKLFTDSGCTAEVASGTAGAASHNLTSSVLGDATHNFYATTTDLAGNTSVCSTDTVQYVLDTAAPSTPSSLSYKTPASGLSNDQTPEFTINGVVSGDTIRLFSDACSTQVGSAVAAGTTVDITSSSLAEAGYTMYANSTDPAGNTSGCVASGLAYTVDISPPGQPSAVTLTVPGSSPGNDTTPTFNVDGVVSGDLIELYSDASCSTSLGSVTSTGTDQDVTTNVLAQASYTVYADATDPAGNTSTCSAATATYVLDTTPPTKPSGLTLNIPATSPNNDTTPTINIAGLTNGFDVTLYTDSGCTSQVATGTSAAASHALTSVALGDATHNFYATSTDLAGNESLCSTATVQYVLDTAAPSAPSSLSYKTPASGLSNDQTPEFTINGVVSGDTVRLFSDACSTQVGSAVAGGATVDITSSSLAEAAYTMYANSTDPAGNTSGCVASGLAYTVDISPPGQPSAVALTVPGSSPGNDTTPTFNVDGVVSGDLIELYSDASCSTSLGSVTSTGTDQDVTTNVLAQASYTVYADATDPAGNTSTCSAATATYVLDTTPPTKPSGLTLNTPATSPSNDTTPTINIAGLTNGFDVTLFTDSGCTSQVATGTSGAASHALTSVALGDATHNFYATTTDLAGNESVCSTATVQYVLDTAAPSAPSSLSYKTPASGLSNDQTPEFTINGVVSGDTVRLFSDACSTQVGSAVAGGATVDITSSSLAEAAYTMYANSTDPAGNVSGCVAVGLAYTVDITPPGQPSAVALTVPGSSPGNDTTPTFNVDGVVSGDLIELYSDASCSTSLGTVTSTGTDQDVTTNVLAQASYTVYADATDPAGNTSTCSAANATYVLDTTPPTKPSGLTLNTPATSPNNDTTPTINIAGLTSGFGVKLFTDSGCTTEVASGTAGAASHNLTSLALGDATHDFYANTTDLAGNTSVCSTATVEYVLDTNPPAKPTNIAYKTPASSPSNDQTPEMTISGVVSGDTVRLYSDACTTEVGNAVAGATTVDVTASTMGEAAYTMYATTTDPAGNSSGCSVVTLAYTVDVSAPAKPNAISFVTPSSSPGNVTTPTLDVGGVATNDFVEIFTDAACTVLKGSATSGGTNVNVSSSALSQGAYTFYAKTTDQAGNPSVCSTVTLAYTVDTTAPSKPTSLTLKVPSTSPNNDPTPEITVGGVISGDVVKLYTDAGCTAEVASGTSGGASIDLTASSLGDGPYDFYAESTDPAGNPSGCSTATVAYVLDTGVPAKPSSITRNTPATTPGNNTTPSFNVGGVASTDTVRIFTDACTTEVGDAVSGGATAVVTVGSALGEASYTIYANTTDAAGNTSVCSTVTAAYEVDTSAPAIPNAVSLSSPSSPGNDTTPNVQIGGVVSGDTVKLFTDGSCSTEVGSGVAAGATIILTSSVLTENTYTFYANSTDPAGNTSNCSSANDTYVLDLTPPAKATALNLGTPNSSPNNDDTPTINIDGVISGNDVRLYTDSGCTVEVAQGTAGGASINLTPTSMSDGTYDFYAKTTDPAGNTLGCSTATVQYVLDTVLPAKPTSLTLRTPASTPNNDSTLEIRVSGVVNGHDVNIYTDAGCSSFSVGGTASGTTIDLTTPALSEATHTFYAEATDLAGNDSGCSAVSVVYTYDGTAPSRPTNITLNNPGSSPNNDDTPEFTVDGVANGDTVTLHTNSGCSASVGSLVSSGASVDVTTTNLPDASYNIYANSTDPAGNTSLCSLVFESYVLDTTPPAKPSNVTLFAPATSPNNDDTPTIKVDGLVTNDTVKLFTDVGCTVEVVSLVATGASMNLTPAAMGDGTYDFYAKAIDPVGNDSGCSTATVQYELDTAVPNDPSGLTLQVPSTSPNNDTTPTIRVAGVAPTDIVSIYTNSGCSTLKGTNTSTGATVDVTSSALTDAVYTFWAKSVDPAGNESGCSSANVSYDLDTIPPSKPTNITLKSPASSPGTDPTPELTVYGVIVSDIAKVFTDASCTAEIGAAVATGTNQDVITSSLADATYTLYAASTDIHGNQSPCSTASVSYEVDSTPPNKPTALTLNNPLSSPNTDDTPTININGTVNGDTITMYEDSSCTSSVGTGVATGASINITASPSLSDGSYDFYAQAADPVGNLSGCSTATIAYVLDTVDPPQPAGLALSAPTSSPGNDSTPTITATNVEVNTTLQLHDNAGCSSLRGSVVVAGSPQAVTVSTPMTEGTKTFYMKAIDQAGNESACSISNIAYEYDTTNPDPVTSLSNATTTSSGSQSPQATWNASGSGDLHHYEVALGTSSGGNEVVDWTDIATPLLYQYTTLSLTNCASYYISVRAVDEAGNKSTVATGPSFTYDGVDPGLVSGLYLDGDGDKDDAHTVHWAAATDNCTLSSYEVAIGETSGGEEILTYTDVGNVLSYQETGISPDLEFGQDYYTNVRAVDAAGNKGTPVEIGPWRRPSPTGIFTGDRTTAPTANTNLNRTTPYELTYTNSSFDPDYFNHSVGVNPEEVEVLVGGDYLLTFNMPVACGSCSGQRVAIHSEVLVNGVPYSTGSTSPSYIRDQQGHNESSDHLALMLYNLSANDKVSVQVSNGTNRLHTTTTTGAAMNLEYVASTRTIFSASSTQTTLGTDLNEASEAALEWTEDRNDAGITHSDVTNPDLITLGGAGDYLVFLNIPVESACNADRHILTVRVKINGSLITGGVSNNGYIRCDQGGDTHRESSYHWAGLIRGVSASSNLTVTTQRASTGTLAVRTRTGKAASIFVEKVDTSRRVLSLRATQLEGPSNEWNPTGFGKNILWGTQDIIDTDLFAHTAGSNVITVKRGGDYQVTYNDFMQNNTTARTNNVVEIEVNGTPLGPAACQTHYIRDAGGVEEASCAMVYTLNNLSYDDEITFNVRAEAATGGGVNDGVPTIMTIIKK